MRGTLLLLLSILMVASVAWSQSSVGPVKVIYPTKFDVSPPLRDLAVPVPEFDPGEREREIPNRPSIYEGAENQSNAVDPVWQDSQGPRPAGPTIQNFEGQSVFENPSLLSPPDTEGEVGPNHYFQMINVIFSIYDKSGNRILGPSLNNVLWTGFGGNCEFSNSGDPIVLYDQLADRWVASQFTSPGGASATECFAVSTSPDPTGSYFRYEFPTPGNDYPKFSVWDDGGGQSAYLGGIRNFSGAFQFDGYAFERDDMLAGNPNPQLVVFNMSSLLPGINNFLSSDVEGFTLPPTGTPGMFLGIENPAIPQNDLVMFELTVDWNNVGNSTLTGPTFIPVAEFNGNVCNFARNCIPQPNTTRGVDGFADAMMFRLPYRNFGTHQSLVCVHTVDVGDFPDHAGLRWHELRNTGSGWSLFQEGTYAPDSEHRWMPSISQNANGDIMVGYSVSSSRVFPSIRYTGRQAGDPLNQMTFAEGTIINGSGSQLSTGSRWGDYSDMTVDPSDDLTFWFTTEYYQTTANVAWQTRIASMQATPAPPNMLMTITPVGSTTIPAGGGTLTFDITVTNISNTSVNLDVWNFIVTPNGNEIGPTVGPVNVNFPANQTKNFTNKTQNIPGGAPAGNYTLGFRLGGFPGNVIAEDSFGFTKTAGPSAGKTVASLDGWDSNWDEGSVVLANAAPETFVLEQNYPNPFNPSTVIRYGLSDGSQVKLRIYNILGEEVATLVDEFQSAGFKTVSWDGRNAAGQTVSAGVYLYKLEAGGVVKTNKMVFAK